MLRAFEMLFAPYRAWEKIVAADPGWVRTFLLLVVPVLAITSAVESAGLLNFPERHSEMASVIASEERVLKHQIVYVGSSLLIVFLGASALRSVAGSFDVRASYSQAFAVVAYAYTPVMLVHLLDAIPRMNTWICLAIGIALSFQVLYHGVGLCLRPEQTKGFGLFLFSVLLLAVVSAVSHFAAVMVLRGQLWRQPLELSAFLH